MREPKNLTWISLIEGNKTTTEKEGVISLSETKETLIQHRRGLVSRQGRVEGKANFFTHCGELYNFIMERMKEGREEITIRIVGQGKTENTHQFVWRDGGGKDHTYTVHKCCIHNSRKVHPSQRMYEPIPAGISLSASVAA